MSNNDQKSQPAGDASPAFGCSAWISCRERLPPVDVPVLVCETNRMGHLKATTLATYGRNPWSNDPKKMAWSVIENCSGYGCDPDKCNPLFWMHLPDLPNPTNQAAAGSNQKGSDYEEKR